MNYKGPGIYRHYKGGRYEVLGLAVREDSLSKESDRYKEIAGLQFVVYKPLSPGSLLPKPSMYTAGEVTLWARLVRDFNEDVWVGENSVPRFVKLG